MLPLVFYVVEVLSNKIGVVYPILIWYDYSVFEIKIYKLINLFHDDFLVIEVSMTSYIECDHLGFKTVAFELQNFQCFFNLF